MEKNSNQKIWTRIVAKAWEDEGYKARLLADPASVLKAEGIDVPAGKTVAVLEAKENQALFVLPRPGSVEIVEGEERLAAWMNWW
jgi:hypothetical protein